MFEWQWIDELGADGTADALARSHDKVVAAEAEQLRLAVHWADVHAPDYVDECRDQLPGAARDVPAGADGCPEIDEFAGAELAVLLGRSTRAGEQMIADGVNIRHRHPLLWTGIGEGRIRVWVATKVARRCAAAGLTRDQAIWVDSQTTPYLMTLPLGRFFSLVEARIKAADPAAAAERAEAEALARFVRCGRTDEHGMRTLVARANAGDVSCFVAVIDRLAAVLAEQGDDSPADVRRASALKILANPARALAMLTGATLEHVDDLPEPLSDDLAGTVDAGGRHLADRVDSPDQLADQPVDEALDGLDDELAGHLRGMCGRQPLGDVAVAAGAPTGLPESDRRLLRSLLESLRDFDASRLDPVTVVHVHVSEAALHSRVAASAGGPWLARVEDVGPMLLDSLRQWLGESRSPHRIQLRPVLDHVTVVPVDRYEIPRAMRELVEVRDPFEVFPYGTLPSRRCDKDHRRRYVDGPPDGRPPPGQTSLANLAPLSRKHHRLKTHGGWRLHQPEPGVSWWRTPHGHWVRVDEKGTHQHGRDPALDLRLGIAVLPPSAVV